MNTSYIYEKQNVARNSKKEDIENGNVQIIFMYVVSI